MLCVSEQVGVDKYLNDQIKTISTLSLPYSVSCYLTQYMLSSVGSNYSKCLSPNSAINKQSAAKTQLEIKFERYSSDTIGWNVIGKKNNKLKECTNWKKTETQLQKRKQIWNKKLK